MTGEYLTADGHLMTADHVQVLAVALVDSVDDPEKHTEHVGELGPMVAAVNEGLRADFAVSDFDAALEILVRLPGFEKSASTGLINVRPHELRMAARWNRAAPRFDIKELFPLVFEYAHFGREWLKAVWPYYFDPLGEPLPREYASRAGSAVAYDSSSWTGIRETVISAKNCEVVAERITRALDLLDRAPLSNTQKQQATVMLEAAVILLQAPEPPSDLIWTLISRAADVSGLIALFISLFAVF